MSEREDMMPGDPFEVSAPSHEDEREELDDAGLDEEEPPELHDDCDDDGAERYERDLEARMARRGYL